MPAFAKIREMSYDSATFDGRGFDARYSTDTGLQLRVRSELAGVHLEAVDPAIASRYALVWGLANFGRLFTRLLPIRLYVRALSLEPDEQAAWHSWMIGILSEHFHQHGLPPHLDLDFEGPRLTPRGSGPRLREQAILMSGGGKDSVVAGELLNSLGVPFRWYGVREIKHETAGSEIADICGNAPPITGEWFNEVNRRGRFRQLTPTTFKKGLLGSLRPPAPGGRWLSLVGSTVEACFVAEATGSRYVLTGSDRSANQGNGIQVGDVEVNHQFTKSYALERELAPFLARYLHPELQHASLLMPFYEIQIGRRFAGHPEYFGAFRSCNRRTATRPWCLECPKCAFVFLLMSAFVDQDTVTAVFGADLLGDPALVPTYLELCGRRGHKPLECVGHHEESLLALHLASRRRCDRLPVDLAAILPDDDEADALARSFLQAYNLENGLPAAWNDALRALVASGLDRS